MEIENVQVHPFMMWLATKLGKKEIVKEEAWGMTYYTFWGKYYVTEYHDYEEDYHL